MRKNIKLLAYFILGIVYYLFVELTSIYIPCVFHEITHLWCPGCGVTRMLINIVRGNFKKAFHCNQLLFISFPIFLIIIIDLFYSNMKSKTPLYEKIPKWIYYVYIALLILFMIIRNIFPYFTPTGI